MGAAISIGAASAITLLWLASWNAAASAGTTSSVMRRCTPPTWSKETKPMPLAAMVKATEAPSPR